VEENETANEDAKHHAEGRRVVGSSRKNEPLVLKHKHIQDVTTTIKFGKSWVVKKNTFKLDQFFYICFSLTQSKQRFFTKGLKIEYSDSLYS
jgi:hypothetical protein